MENRKREAIIEEIKVLLGDNKDEQEKFIRLTTSCYKPTKNGEPCWTCSKCTHIRDEKMMSIENKINQRFSV
jgi:7-cyano-7-deazaguanine synthase in queuosine biosynthesis